MTRTYQREESQSRKSVRGRGAPVTSSDMYALMVQIIPGQEDILKQPLMDLVDNVDECGNLLSKLVLKENESKDENCRIAQNLHKTHDVHTNIPSPNVPDLSSPSTSINDPHDLKTNLAAEDLEERPAIKPPDHEIGLCESSSQLDSVKAGVVNIELTQTLWNNDSNIPKPRCDPARKDERTEMNNDFRIKESVPKGVSTTNNQSVKEGAKEPKVKLIRDYWSNFTNKFYSSDSSEDDNSNSDDLNGSSPGNPKPGSNHEPYQILSLAEDPQSGNNLSNVSEGHIPSISIGEPLTQQDIDIRRRMSPSARVRNWLNSRGIRINLSNEETKHLLQEMSEINKGQM